MSSSIIRRRRDQIGEISNLQTRRNEPSSNYKNNKKWWRILKPNTNKNGRETVGQISEKVRDQVALDVKRAFSFRNHSFSGRNGDFYDLK